MCHACSACNTCNTTVLLMQEVSVPSGMLIQVIHWVGPGPVPGRSAGGWCMLGLALQQAAAQEQQQPPYTPRTSLVSRQKLSHKCDSAVSLSNTHVRDQIATTSYQYVRHTVCQRCFAIGSAAPLRQAGFTQTAAAYKLRRNTYNLNMHV